MIDQDFDDQNVIWVRWTRDPSVYVPLVNANTCDGSEFQWRVAAASQPATMQPSLTLHSFVPPCSTNFQDLSTELILEIFSWFTPNELFSHRYLLLNKHVNGLLMSKMQQGTRQQYWYQLIEQSVDQDEICEQVYPTVQALRTLLDNGGSSRDAGNHRKSTKIQFHGSSVVNALGSFLEHPPDLQNFTTIELSWHDIALNQLYIQAKQTYRMVHLIWNRIESFISLDVKHNLRSRVRSEHIQDLKHVLSDEWRSLLCESSPNRSIIEQQLQRQRQQRPLSQREQKQGRPPHTHMLALPLDLLFSMLVHDGEDSPSGVMLSGGFSSEHGLGSVLGFTRLLSAREMTTLLKMDGMSQSMIEGLCLLPITSQMGEHQLCVNVLRNVISDDGGDMSGIRHDDTATTTPSYKFGEIYLVSGWNVFKKADSWLHYLYELMDIPLHSVQFPIVL